MEILFVSAGFAAFFFGYPGSLLLLRCGFSACMRFSPRACIALTGVCGVSSALPLLLSRDLLRSSPGEPRTSAAVFGFAGGVFGRMLLLMYTARFSGSHDLLMLQAVPLALLCTAALFSAQFHPYKMPQKRMPLLLLSFCCAGADGFFGAGSDAILALASHRSILRRSDGPSSFALIVGFCAQSGALLFTILCGAAQVFPARIPVSLALGAALGAYLSETAVSGQKNGYKKTRSAIHQGLRSALKIYLLFAALSCCEQAFL